MEDNRDLIIDDPMVICDTCGCDVHAHAPDCPAFKAMVEWTEGKKAEQPQTPKQALDLAAQENGYNRKQRRQAWAVARKKKRTASKKARKKQRAK